MGSTTRFGLHYLGQSDAPDLAGATQLLAEDADTWLCRWYPVADATARQSLTGVPEGFGVRQQSDGSLWVRTNNATWDSVGASSASGGGGGGGTSATEGQWAASSNQNLPNGADTVLAFGATEVSSALVARATSGSGHKFTLAEDGAYAVTATVRFAPGATGSRFIELRNSAQTVRHVADGDQGGPAAASRSFSITKRFSAAAELLVVATQSSGGTLATQYQGTSITDGFVRLNICKIAD